MARITVDNRAMLTTREAAAALGVEPQTLNIWRRDNKGPVYHRVGTRAIRYNLADIEEFRDRHRIVTSMQA